ncbi:MAG: DNA helicase RecQ [Candidatus Baltobacteraceae bacterium]
MTLFDRDPGAALKHHFGFEAFRPLQEQIVADVLAGRDLFALLPTGGGKSLCYQLPAVMRPGLTMVVSPLIALMKDQVDGLRTAGIPATFLNSSLGYADVRRRMEGLARGEYRLLYVAPERLRTPDFYERLAEWGLARIAIDEAHCISEWGHDFRPEYRTLAELRRRYPAIPIAALTATATGRVRDDVIAQLGLRAPHVYVASFDRPNLTYRVTPKLRAPEALVRFVRERERESGIVYCATRRTTEAAAGRLCAAGIPAAAYHAGLEPGTRARVQERFVRDDVRVICATIAFGMGIDKPNVRYVVHYDLPKNVEGYYQETGRAGRDGLPSDCLLFFSAGDIAKQQHFIDEKPEPERSLARAQLTQMTRFAQSGECRRRSLLAYFGETYPAGPCGACDNCLEPRARVDATTDAYKLLSCVVRAREASGFGFGLHHLVDVLLGHETDRMWRFGHDRLSTYGIGKDRPRAGWLALGNDLLRQGLLESEGAHNTLALTPEGRGVLAERRSVEVTSAPPTPARRGSTPTGGGAPKGDGSYDVTLFERLRTLRRRIADERDVPAYVIFPDTTLRAIAHDLPRTLGALRRIGGVGDKKLAEFGQAFVEAVAAYAEDAAAPTAP